MDAELRVEGLVRAAPARSDWAGSRLPGEDTLHRLLVEHASDLFTMVDVEGRVLYASPSHRKVLGYAPEELVGTPVLQFVHPDDVETIARALTRSGNAEVPPVRIRHRDGSWRLIEFVGVSVPIDGLAPIALAAVGRDLTESRRAEAALREAEARYRTLVEQIPAVTYTRDVGPGTDRPVMRYVSPQIERMLGFPPETFTADAMFWYACVHPVDREAVLAETALATRAAEPFDMEYRMLARNGHIVWVRDQTVILHQEEERVLIYQGVVLDITEQKLAEQQLRQTEARYRTLVETIPAVVFVDRPDDQATNLFTSPQTTAILGYTPEDWVSIPDLWFRIIHPEDRDRVKRANEQHNDVGELFDQEYRVITKDGRTIWVRDVAVLEGDEQGRPASALGFFFDVTAQKDAEQRLLHYSSELERANQALRDRERELTAALSELRSVEAERKRLLDQTVHSVEAERKRIAIELHDGPIQHLTALGLRLDAERRRLARQLPESSHDANLDSLQEGLRSEIADLRRVVTNLRPPALDEWGLDVALSNYVSAMKEDSDLDCLLQAHLTRRLPSAIETVLYRVVQEALTNVVRHARARQAIVTLSEEQGEVALEVRDDGIGIGAGTIDERGLAGHFGLLGMRERVQMIGGAWELTSTPGSGTEIRARIPVRTDEAEGLAPGSVGPASRSSVWEDLPSDS